VESGSSGYVKGNKRRFCKKRESKSDGSVESESKMPALCNAQAKARALWKAKALALWKATSVGSVESKCKSAGTVES
jgi:hypothetical protein